MKVICAWCRKILKSGKGEISHGICKTCRTKEIERFEKKMKDRAQWNGLRC